MPTFVKGYMKAGKVINSYQRRQKVGALGQKVFARLGNQNLSPKRREQLTKLTFKLSSLKEQIRRENGGKIKPITRRPGKRSGRFYSKLKI